MKKQLFLLVMILLPMVVSAYDFLVDGYYYNIVSMEDKTVSLAGAEEFRGDVVIPGEIIVGNYTFKVISIDDNVGSYSPNISSITISEGIEKIGDKCFYSTNWNYMSFIKYPSTLKETGKAAFGCTKPTYVYIHDLASWINVKFDKSYPLIGDWYGYNENRQYKRLCIGDVECPDIIIPEGITKIPQNTFYEANILSVTFPSTMKTIDGFNASYMEQIYFSDGNDSISPYAFSGCRYLENVSSPNRISYIGDWAFSDCIKMNSFTINEGVENIFDGTFYNCASLKKVKIPSTCKTIGDNAFYGCTKLDSIYLGKGLKSIGKSAFDACPSTIKIICYSDEAPSIDESSFTTGQYMMAKVIVPVGCKDVYAIASGWKNFVNIIEKEIYTLTYTLDGQVYKTYQLLEGEIITPEPAPIKEGYTFSGWSEIPETMPANDVTVTGTFNINVPVGDVSLDKSEAILEKGKTMTLKATVYPETLEDKSVTWESSDTKVATVTSSGKVKGVKAGIVTITCTSVATGATATCDLTVGYVKLDQTEAILEKGESVVLAPTVYPSKLPDRSVTWKSSNAKIATVTSSGEVKGVMAGTATITCTSNATGLSVTCAVTVNGINLSKSEAILEKGKTMTLKPTFYPETLEDKSVTWKSSNTAVATVSSTGKVKGVKAGIVTITCTSVATGTTATCDLTIGYVKLDKTEATLEKGESVVLTPTVYPSKLSDRSVTWKSSNETIATVTSGGEVKGVLAGTATITCTSNATGLSVTCAVTVNGISLSKSEAILEKTKTMTLTPTFYPESLSDKSVTWKSSDTKVATVTSDGTIKGVKAGMVTITCTSVATGATATCKLTVGYVKLDKTEVAVKKNKTVTLTPTVYPSKLEDRSVTWKSSDETVATVTSSGKVKGVKYGTATITCTSNATGLSTTCTVTVGTVYLNIAEVTIHKGRALTLTPTVYPNTLTDKSVTWKSSDKTVATVTSAGKVKGVNSGTATITCTSVATGLSSTCKVTVIEFAGARFVYEDDDDVTGIETLDDTPAVEEPFDVYDLRGRKVMQRVTSLGGLPAGVYIVNGKKVLKK